MSAATIERKYQMVRLGTGDYLLPDNDGERVWRIARYEDGPSHGLDWPRDRQVWAVHLWDRPYPIDEAEYDEAIDWSNWMCVQQVIDTRRAAIDIALASEAQR